MAVKSEDLEVKKVIKIAKLHILNTQTQDPY